MKTTTLAKKSMAYFVAAWMAAQPAFGAQTDVSQVPLGSSAGAGFLPNLLFTLDNSGSMDWTFLPDYVDPNTSGVTSFPCLNDINPPGGFAQTDCQLGDPPYAAGGQFAMNGVGYDPNFTYVVGLDFNGTQRMVTGGNLTPATVINDAYLGGGTTNITTGIQDRRFCNGNGVCKRNGADNTNGLVLPSGATDASTTAVHTLGAGQFPWRTHPSNSSTLIFALPEMMPIGTFIRNTTGTGGFVGSPTSLVQVTTVEAHGLTGNGVLATSDTIYTTVTNMGVTCVPINRIDNFKFTYSTGATSAQNRTGSYRKCVNPGAASFVRTTPGNTVTVTSPNHGLVTNDIITTANLSTANMAVASATVTGTAGDTFTYVSSATTTQSLSGSWVRNGLYNSGGTVNGPAVAYAITPVEYCTDLTLTNCIEYTPNATPAQTVPSGQPAYVRFCKTQADALAPGAVTGTSGSPATPRCQSKFVDITVNGTPIQYRFPRFGWFKRDTIRDPAATPAGPSKYTNRPNRSDCVTTGTKPDCTYTEEINNYAKWWAYYRKRMQMMKTSAGRAFLPFVSNASTSPPKPDRLRVGFITIHVQDSGTIDANQYLKIDTFNTTNAQNWYTKFYAQNSNNATPLREALSRAGWIFAGKLTNASGSLTAGISSNDDPVQASCQKNFTFLTTDGFWNGNAGKKLDGTAIGNHDNVDKQLVGGYADPDFMVARTDGTFDGNLLSGTTAGASAGGSGTLADVAMYYYETDLRPAGSTSPNGPLPLQDVSANNVQAKSGSVDFATHQHMNTYTIGLADGLMRYTADYDDPAKASDFNSIRGALPAAGNCFWATNTCDWPTPQENNQSALDDLWHAAVNGRGRFYSALNPTSLSTGLSSALNNLNVATASAAAAATSSPQVSQQGSKAFSTTYQTATWAGDVYAQLIDPLLGTVITTGTNDGKIWEAQKLLVPKANAGLRRLLTYDVGVPGSSGPPVVTAVPPVASRLKDFRWTAGSNGALNGFEKTNYFLNKCIPLTTMGQCSTLTPLQQVTANDGTSLVDYLSGKPTLEGTVFRDRTEIDPNGTTIQTVLGDIVNSQPLFVRAPFFDYSGVRPNGHGETIAEGPGEVYSTFQTNNVTRPGALLIGANDGFLHAFAPETIATPAPGYAAGEEMWAYMPRFLMPNMYQLADSGYPGQHRYYVDGTPELADVFDKTAGKWRTIVVGGTNAGGRGWYALDITDPTSPKALWEICADATLCPNDYFDNSLVRSDPDLGFSYGNPVIGRRKVDGKWVVVLTSGLNNVPTTAVPGATGQGYFFILDALSGKILHKVLADDGGIGSTTTPSGLMKQGAYYPAGLDDPLFTHVYGGDQLGIVWRMDLTTTAPMKDYPTVTTGAPWVKRLATLQDAAGRVQPLTARPAGTHLGPSPYDPNATRIYYVGTGRYIGNSDLTDLGTATDPAWQQTIYGIRDQLDNPRAGFDPKKPFRAAAILPLTFAVQQTLALSGGGPDRTISKKTVDWTKQDGFFVDLNPKLVDTVKGDSPGERVVLDVRLILGTVIFTSTIPKSGCEPGGDSFQYFLDFKTGGYVGNDSTTIAGKHIGSFLVGTAIEQTADDLVKALNKTVSGENKTAAIPTDSKFLGQRFSYRER